MSEKETFDINTIKVASTYDPNDPFSPMPPTPQRPKMYENLNDILVRTSREEYLKKRQQRLENQKREKAEQNRMKQIHEARQKQLLAEQEHIKKLKEARMKRDRVAEKKETTGYVELKRKMTEMYCKPMNRPTSTAVMKAKNLQKKSSTQKSSLKVKEEDIFDFTPLNNKRDKQLKTNKDESVRRKKDENSSTFTNGFGFVEDDNIQVAMTARATADAATAQLSESATIDNEFDSNLSRPTTPVNTENNLEPINIKEEFSDNFVKSEPNFDDSEYSNQDATRYFANDDDEGNDGDEDYDNDYEDIRSAGLQQQKPPQSRIDDSYDYSAEVNNEADDLETATASTTEHFDEIQGFVKQEIPDEYF